MKRFVPLAMLVGIISLAAVACGGGGDSDPNATPRRSSPSPVPPAPTLAPAPTAASQPTTQAGGIAVDVLNHDLGGSGTYAFEPADFNFKVGDTVTFATTAETEYHTFTVDDLGIDQAVNGGETVTFTHTFDKAGSFTLICIPHQALGMVGTITVQ